MILRVTPDHPCTDASRGDFLFHDEDGNCGIRDDFRSLL